MCPPGHTPSPADVDHIRTQSSLMTCHLVSEPPLTSSSAFHDAGWYQGLLGDVEGETAPEVLDQGCPLLFLCSSQTFQLRLRDCLSWVQFPWSFFLISLSGTPWTLRRWASTIYKCPLPPTPILSLSTENSIRWVLKKYSLMENCFPASHWHEGPFTEFMTWAVIMNPLLQTRK